MILLISSLSSLSFFCSNLTYGTGYSTTKKTAFLWEGVTMYLDRENIDEVEFLISFFSLYFSFLSHSN